MSVEQDATHRGGGKGNYHIEQADLAVKLGLWENADSKPMYTRWRTGDYILFKNPDKSTARPPADWCEFGRGERLDFLS